MEPTWVTKKTNLKGDCPWLISKDWGVRGAKQFACLASFDEMIQYLESNKGASLYEIILHTDLPCFMYYDIDLPNVENTPHIVEVFLTTLQHFLNTSYQLDITWNIGENCQIATASTPSKCSIHFLGYVLMPSVEKHRLFNTGLVEYIINNQINELLFLNKKNEVQCAIDASVYTHFRSYRCLYMTKAGRNAELLPYNQSSTRIADHLVIYHPGISTSPVASLSDIHVYKEVKSKSSATHKSLIKQQHAETPDNEKDKYISDALEFIKNDYQIRNLLNTKQVKTSYRYIRYDLDEYRIHIDHKSKAVCPFAKRSHSNNHLYFRGSFKNKSLTLLCYNEDCSKHLGISITSFHAPSVSRPHYDIANIKSLHTLQHNIDWTDVYTLPFMNPYPSNPIVCVRAGMGLGKTVAMKQFIATHFLPTTKALIVTFSRSLAKKYAQDFAPYGFVNYQDVSSSCIPDGKIIVCLDSLWRVLVRNPDYVFIDEALSIFLHFNSPLMNRTSEISTLLELLIHQAKHTFFIDACIDHTFMVNVVNYFCRTKNVQASWIWNKYVRDTNRRVVLHHVKGYRGTKTITENPVAFASFQRVMKCIEQGQRVVVCSSLKRYTIILYDLITKKYPHIRAVVYNSDTTKQMMNNNESIDTSTWCDVDVLIYSPSITAGVSFEALHFDVLVGYLVNSRHTPSVDCVLQQLFRVRQLKEGTMYLHVLDQEQNSSLPIFETDIENFLDTDSSLLNKYYMSNNIHFYSQQKINGNNIVYDKERLSYEILKGILMLQNRSSMHFVDTLLHTLQEDYHIPCENNTEVIQCTPEDKAFLSEVENALDLDAPPPFSPEFVIDQENYEDLIGIQELTPLQKIQKRLFDIAVCLWGIEPATIDAEFYEQFVMSSQAYEKFYSMQRWVQAVSSSFDELNRLFHDKMNIIKDSCDTNMDLFKTKYRNYYIKLLSSAQFLDMCNAEWKKHAREKTTWTIMENDLSSKYNEFITNMTSEEKKAFYHLYEIKPSSSAFIAVKKMLSMSFGMSMDRGSTSTKRINFQHLTFGNKLVSEVDKYKPNILDAIYY